MRCVSRGASISTVVVVVVVVVIEVIAAPRILSQADSQRFSDYDNDNDNDNDCIGFNLFLTRY